MKKSEKILKKNGIQEGLSWERRKTIENNILLKHIIDNDLKHLWRLVLFLLACVLGLIGKSFIGG